MQTTAKWRGALLTLGILTAVFVIGGSRWHSTATFAENNTIDPFHPQETFYVGSDSKSLGEAFSNAHVPFYAEDQVTTFPDLNLGIGSVITVTRALPVHLVDGKHSKELRTWQTTVGGLLKEKNIELGQEDRIAPDVTTALQKNLTITITRVARTNVVETETVPFQTTIEKDYTQFVGGQTTLKAGKNGKLEKTYLLIRQDGELVSKTLQSTKTTISPVTAVIRQGGLNQVPSHCVNLKDWVVDASLKNKVDPNALYYRIVRESNCRANSQAAAGYQGLLQYDPSLWVSVSAQAGYKGASIWEAKNQIYVTAWAWAHGYRGRWPSP